MSDMTPAVGILSALTADNEVQRQVGGGAGGGLRGDSELQCSAWGGADQRGGSPRRGGSEVQCSARGGAYQGGGGGIKGGP